MTAELRAAIRDTPADRDVRRVYADWLVQQGDPRGEWIALHDINTEEAELKRRALWQIHGATWRAVDVGTDTFDSLEHARYRGGFLADVQLSSEHLLALAPVLAAQPIRALKIYALADLGALANLPVLETIEELDLGYGLETASADALLAILDATPRLKSLTLSPHQEVPFVWDALARFGRLAELEALDLASIRISADRAKWLAGAVPKLGTLSWSSALTDAALQALAEHATFELRRLYLHDRDGLHGRDRLMTDGGIGAVLQSSFVRGLDVLSLFGCYGGSQIADALANMPCAPRLTSLDLGSMLSGRCVRSLGDAEFPKLEWLSVRHDGVGDGDLEVLARFPTVTTLRAEKNAIGREGVATILAGMPNLVRLSVGDNAIGDHGVIAIGYSDHVAKLRHLEISSTHCSTDAVEALIDGGKLTALRSLELACNEDITRAGIKALADGPFDRLELLSLSYVSRSPVSALFGHAWLPAEESGEDKYQRRLQPGGRAVPHKSKPKPPKKVVAADDARAIDATSEYKKGEHVKHPDYGVGVVEHVTPLYLSAKFPRHGAFRFGRTPSHAIPFDTKKRFAPEQVIVHPTLGAGIVRSATADRVEIEFGIGGKKTLVHGRS